MCNVFHCKNSVLPVHFFGTMLVANLSKNYTGRFLFITSEGTFPVKLIFEINPVVSCRLSDNTDNKIKLLPVYKKFDVIKDVNLLEVLPFFEPRHALHHPLQAIASVC